MFEALIVNVSSLSVFFLSVFVISFASALIFTLKKPGAFIQETKEAWLVAFFWLLFYCIFKQSDNILPVLFIFPFLILTGLGRTSVKTQTAVCFACCFTVSFLLPSRLLFLPLWLLPFWGQRLLIGCLMYLISRLFTSFKQLPYILDDHIKSLGFCFLILSCLRFSFGTEIYYAVIPLFVLWAFSFFTKQSGGGALQAFGFLTGFFVLYLVLITKSLQPFVFLSYLLFEACYGFYRRFQKKEPEFFIQKTISEHPEYTDSLLNFMKYRLMFFGLLSISGALYKSNLIFVFALFLVYEIVYQQNRVGQPNVTLRSLFHQMKEDWKNIKENYRKKTKED